MHGLDSVGKYCGDVVMFSASLGGSLVVHSWHGMEIIKPFTLICTFLTMLFVFSLLGHGQLEAAVM